MRPFLQHTRAVAQRTTRKSSASALTRCFGSSSSGIYSYGEGYLGSLGTGKYDAVETPTLLPTTSSLCIKDLSAGWAHAGFVTQDGQVYAFGRTHSFRDVIRSTNIQRIAPWLLSWMNNFTLTRGFDTLTPTLIPLPENEKATKMVCSAALTLVLTESGKVFAFGANNYGQCGIGKESVSVTTPELVSIEGETVVDIAAGYQHALAVTQSGAVFAWGKGERGQLGFGSANISAPQEIIALRNKRIASVSAGFNHSSALSADGELFLWGKLLHPDGKASDKSPMGDQIVPRLVPTTDSVRLLQCSHFHTTFVTSDGRLWIVGRTPSGRQVTDQDASLVHLSSAMHTVPFEIPLHEELDAHAIVKMGKGVDNTTLLTADGRAFEWTFTFGVQPVADTHNLNVLAMESGFRYRLLLGNARDSSSSKMMMDH